MESVALSLYQAHFFKEKKNICLNKQIKSCISLKIIASCLLRVKNIFFDLLFLLNFGVSPRLKCLLSKSKGIFYT